MKRPLLIIAVCLLLGAVVNVAVAWGCALLSADEGHTVETWTGDLPKPSDPLLLDRWRVATGGRAGVYVVAVFGPWVEARTEDGDHVGKRLPGWVSRALFGNRDPCVVIDSRGWPFPTLYSVTNFGGLPIPTVLHAPKDFTPVGALTTDGYALPFRPIWTAFAINTLFYATLLWLLIIGSVVLRRFLRLRRGLCPKCAYPMGESAVCTECGGAMGKRRESVHSAS